MAPAVLDKAIAVHRTHSHSLSLSLSLSLCLALAAKSIDAFPNRIRSSKADSASFAAAVAKQLLFTCGSCFV
jgi:hypothetical protein